MSDSDASTRSLVKVILEIESPVESELVDTFDPAKAFHGITSKGPSGFGGAHEIALLLPIVWELIDAFFKEAKKQAIAEVVKQLKDSLVRAVKGRSAREAQTAAALSLIATALQASGVEAHQSLSVASTVWKVLLDSKLVSNP